jgi:hypothetical protein
VEEKKVEMKSAREVIEDKERAALRRYGL